MSLKSFFHSIGDFFKNLFHKIPEELQKAVHIGVVVTEAIKNFSDSGGVDVLTSLIPGNLDDTIKNALRAKLPVILAEMKLAENCANLTDPNEIVACAINTLQSISGDYQSAFLHDLSVLIAQVAADNELSWQDGVLIAQWYYEHEFKK